MSGYEDWHAVPEPGALRQAARSVQALGGGRGAGMSSAEHLHELGGEQRCAVLLKLLLGHAAQPVTKALQEGLDAGVQVGGAVHA